MKNPLKMVRPFMTKHEPEILMAMGISGLVFATVWSIRASFKTCKAIETYKQEHNLEKLTPREYLKLSWKNYLPVVISTAMSIPCVICGNRVSNKRYAALATAYTISETALQEYQEKTRELVGDRKARSIQEAVNEDKIQKTYTGTNQIIMTNNGEDLFFEPISGRYFKSTWNDISKAANDLNAKALSNVTGYITLNEWFDKLGLENTVVGDELGWSLQSSNRGGMLIDIEISSHLTSDNRPCGAISYRYHPIELKDSLY